MWRPATIAGIKSSPIILAGIGIALKYQSAARERWLAEHQKELLPISCFHVVFTLPQQLAPLALQNKRVVYGILFKAGGVGQLRPSRRGGATATHSTC
jgi:hypothetical protein